MAGEKTIPATLVMIKKIDVQSLRRALKRMRGKKFYFMEEALMQLVKKSIDQRRFAKKWKPQLVKPLQRKKENTSLANYRPVSNLVEVRKLVRYSVA